MRDRAHLGPRHQQRSEVDFVVIGSGAAGGVMARELARAGFSVVVLEQGPYLNRADFHHDDFEVIVLGKYTGNPADRPHTHRLTPNEEAKRREYLIYAKLVGGSSVHFAANYWRFREIDFVEKTRKGAVAGTAFDDWPITYADLEPYYTRAEWEVGVSGQAGVNPNDAPRSRPYPMPPLPITGAGAVMEIGAKKLGWLAQPAPMAILSRPYRGRSACMNCGFCWGFGCEWGAKSSSLFSMIPDAVRTGRCEIRPNSYVHRIETDDSGRVTGVVYFDSRKREQRQRAKAVVLSANGAESARLLLLSTSSRFPRGLANSSGLVGKNLMFNGGSVTGARYEHAVNAHKGAPVSRIVIEDYELPESLGLTGGGGMDFRGGSGPFLWTMFNGPLEGPRWGMGLKKMLRDYYTTSLIALTHTSSLPVEANAIDLDPTLKDAWGVPAIRVTYKEHDNDVKLMKYMQDRSVQLLEASGALEMWRYPVGEDPGAGFHLLGTCRMGNDASRSVVDKYHRAHGVKNLFIVDGSSFVTSGRGQPTLTIQALAFRAAEYLVKAAKAGDV
ncbi:MAG: GMC family oxidoreductase [Gemmatimonadaceae bacterium]